MPKRSSKKPRAGKTKSGKDVNEIAANIAQQATRKDHNNKPIGKNPAAVVLGRLGGKKGRPARAKKLSRKRRSKIAQKAAIARWSQSK